MKDYVKKIIHEESGSLSVCFYIEQDTIIQIGEKMNQIHELAYMNGYNWEVVLNYYLAAHHPDILDGMGNDPEAGMYVAYYKQTPENDKKADKLVEIIKDLVENETMLYELVDKEGENMEWD